MKTKTVNITIPIHYNDVRNCYPALLLAFDKLLQTATLKPLLDDPLKDEVRIRIRPIETNEG